METSSTKLTESTPSLPEGCELPGIGSPMLDDTRSRAEWIRNWLTANPDRVAPCSAKSIYRLADSTSLRLYLGVTESGLGLDLTDLKERSAQVDRAFSSLSLLTFGCR